MNNDSKVHIQLINERYYNGIIIEVNSNNFILEDRLIGKILIFYNELKHPIELYKEESKNE